MDKFQNINEVAFDETVDSAKDRLWNSSQPIIEAIVDDLADYDIFDFLVRLSALNLLPKNQNKCTVLDLIIDGLKDDFLAPAIDEKCNWIKLEDK